MKRAFLLACLAWTLTASAQVPSYVPTDGLVAWYPFNGNANDESGNGNNGTPLGPSLTSDRFNAANSAYEFDGNNDFIDCGNSSSIQVAGELTYVAWINLDTYTNFAGIIGRGEGTGGSKAISMLMITRSNTQQLYFEISEGASNEAVASPTGAILANNWYHVAGVWHGPDQDSMSVFINGELISTAPTTFNAITGGTDSNDNMLKIGNRDRYNNGFSYGWFDGIIDDVGIWSRALSNDEIIGLYLSSPPLQGCTNSSACNFDSNANLDDGSCIPSGCMEEGACNYKADAQCEGEACDYSCCPGPGCCGEGMHWDADAQTCVITPPSVAPDTDCTLLNLQELAEGYQILLAENTQLDSLLADCNGMSTSDQSGPCAGEDVVTYHGYDYDIVEIGDQCWFAENLQSFNYRTGHEISQIGDDIGWSNATSGAVCAYPSSSDSAEIGLLYNWWSTVDYRGLCPPGWDIPSDYQWMQLEIELGVPSATVFNIGYRGSNEGVGTSMKATGTWDSGVPGSNISGFNALPAGWRTENGAFTQLGEFTHWHSRSIASTGAYYRGLGANGTGIARAASYREAGRSVRCVKD